MTRRPNEYGEVIAIPRVTHTRIGTRRDHSQPWGQRYDSLGHELGSADAEVFRVRPSRGPYCVKCRLSAEIECLDGRGFQEGTEWKFICVGCDKGKR